MKFEMEEILKLFSDIEKVPTPILKLNAKLQTSPTNQAIIITWIKKSCYFNSNIGLCKQLHFFSY